MGYRVTIISLLAILLSGGFTLSPGAETTSTKNIVYVIPIEGAIEPALLYVVRRGVKEAHAQGAKALIFRMDTPGGTLDAAGEIVNLIENLDIPTYTFVEEEAFSAGAIIALATDNIYMSPGSVIGDAMPMMMGTFSGPQELPEAIQEKMVSAVAALIRSAAEQGGHDTELAEAMVRRENEYKIGEEIISRKGELLTLTDKEAGRLIGDEQKPLLSAGTVRDLDSMLEVIGHPDSIVREIQVTTAEKIARIIKAMAMLFLGAGILGIYVEIKSPGLGFPGILGALSLAVFFWGHHIAGLAGTGEMLIVLVGIILLLVEILLIPGFGVAGMAGLLCILSGLLLAMVEHYPGGPIFPEIKAFRFPLVHLTGGLCITLVGAVALTRFLPGSDLFRRVALQAETRSDQGYVSAPDQPVHIGQAGVADSALRPAGTALFDNKPYTVITDGEFVIEGADLRIVEIKGSRIVVTTT